MSPPPSANVNHLPLIEPDNVVAMAWTAVFAFTNDSDNQDSNASSGAKQGASPVSAASVSGPSSSTNTPSSLGQTEHQIGGEVLKAITKIISGLPPDSSDRVYLFEVNNLFLNSLRTLNNRLIGMWQSFKTTNDVETAKQKEAQNLGSITGDVSSLVPRIGATVGGASISPVIANVTNAVIPSIAGISGYELVLFGAFVGYFVIELALRYYSYWEVPRTILKGQRERSQAYNTFLRQAKESLTNLALEGIRLREQFYPNLGTIGKTRFYYGSNAGVYEREKLSAYVKDLVERLVPVVHDSARLSTGIFGSRAQFSKEIQISKGQLLLLSYSVEADRVVDFIVRSQSGNKTIETIARQSGGEFRYFAEQDEALEFVFQSQSLFRSKRVAFGVQITNLDNVDFLPRV